jgi:hypothetical protein
MSSSGRIAEHVAQPAVHLGEDPVLEHHDADQAALEHGFQLVERLLQALLRALLLGDVHEAVEQAGAAAQVHRHHGLEHRDLAAIVAPDQARRPAVARAPVQDGTAFARVAAEQLLAAASQQVVGSGPPGDRSPCGWRR